MRKIRTQLNKLKEFLTLPPNEHPRGHRTNKTIFWSEMFFAVMIGVCWGIVGTIIGLVTPIPSILSLLTWTLYLYYVARDFRNSVWDREHS